MSLAQVPLFLKAGLASGENLMLKTRAFEDVNDAAGNGGYNVFSVFTDNLLSIVGESVRTGGLSAAGYQCFKHRLYHHFLAEYILNLLILKRNSNFDTHSGWKIIRKHYGREWYALPDLIDVTIRIGLRRIARTFNKNTNR